MNKKTYFLLLFLTLKCKCLINNDSKNEKSLDKFKHFYKIDIPNKKITAKIDNQYKNEQYEGNFRPLTKKIKKLEEKEKTKILEKTKLKQILFKKKPKKPRVYQRRSRKKLSPENAKYYGFGR